jgi:hypothetical protein
MEWGITDERKADGLFPSVMSSVIKLPMNNESHTDEIFSSVKLWNLVVKMHNAVQNKLLFLYMNSEWNNVILYKTRRFI